MRHTVSLALLVMLAGCAPHAIVPPSAAPVEAPRPPVPVAAAPSPYVGDWRDWPVTPGSWVYRQDARGSIALFGPPGADAELTLRCDRAAGQVFLSRRGAAPSGSPMTIRTSSTLRTLIAQPTGGAQDYMATALAGRDTLLDAMGFSRGRFIVDTAPLPILVIPAWAEVLRVTEDCRR